MKTTDYCEYTNETTWCEGTCTFGRYYYRRHRQVCTRIYPDGTVEVTWGPYETSNLGCQC